MVFYVFSDLRWEVNILKTEVSIYHIVKRIIGLLCVQWFEVRGEHPKNRSKYISDCKTYYWSFMCSVIWGERYVFVLLIFVALLRDATPLKAVSSSCAGGKWVTRVCIIPRSLYLKDYVLQILIIMSNNLLGLVAESLDCFWGFTLMTFCEYLMRV